MGIRFYNTYQLGEVEAQRAQWNSCKRKADMTTSTIPKNATG